MADLALPEPSYIDRDPQAILADCIASYEAKMAARNTPVTLTPAHQDRLLLDILVYRELLARIGIQEAAKQNTLRYARYPMIDLLAAILGPDAARLPALPAHVMVQYTLASAAVSAVPVAAGSRVRTKDNLVLFATDSDATIGVGQTTSVPIAATATVAGALGNNYATGDVSQLVDLLAVSATVTNTTESGDGSDEETTDAFRDRVPDAIALYAAAGPEDGYKAHAKAVSSDIIDATVSSPAPPMIVISILTKEGAPSTDLLNAVVAACSAEKVRPMNDQVSAVSSTEVDYTIDVGLTLYSGEDSDTAIQQASDALTAYALDRRSGLGRAPADGPIITAIKLAAPGVYNVVVNEPSPNPTVAQTAFALCTSITVDPVVLYVAEKRPAS